MYINGWWKLSIHTIFIGIIPFSFMIIFGFLILKNICKRYEINIISLNNNFNIQQRQRSQRDFQLIRYHQLIQYIHIQQILKLNLLNNVQLIV